MGLNHLQFYRLLLPVNPCEMPKSDGISAQYLDEGLIVLNKNLGFSGNAAARTACIKYLDELDAQCLSKNATFTQDECEKYCGKSSILKFSSIVVTQFLKL